MKRAGQPLREPECRKLRSVGRCLAARPMSRYREAESEKAGKQKEKESEYFDGL